MGDLIGVGLPVLGDRLLDFARGKLDDLFVGAVLGAAALGYYSVGYRLLNFLTDLIVGTVQTVSLPLYARLHREAEPLPNAFLAINRFLAFLAFPVFLGVALMAPAIVPVVFGAKWLPSVPVMQILAVVGLLRIAPAGTSPAVTALGKPSINLYVNLGATAVAAIGFVTVVSQGIVPVALVHLLVAICLLPVTLAIVHRVLALPIRPYLRSFGPSLLGAALMAIAVVGVALWAGGWPATLAGVLLLAAAGGAVYLGSTRLVAPDLFRQARQTLFQEMSWTRWAGMPTVQEEDL